MALEGLYVHREFEKDCSGDYLDEVYWHGQYIGFLYETLSGKESITFKKPQDISISELKEIFIALDEYLYLKENGNT